MEEREREREREGERQTCPGWRMEPATQVYTLDWESNLCPFGPQADAPSTEQHWPGPEILFYKPEKVV